MKVTENGITRTGVQRIGIGPDGQNPRRHPTTPPRIERKISLYQKKISIFENTARKGLPKVRWGSNKQAKDSGSVLYTTRFWILHLAR